jgi:glycosyltransferase involved in cell wall biosynthesis
MDGLFTPARYLQEKAQRLYRLEDRPDLLPTPVEVPERVAKAKEPTVCFVGRWDRVKRPELFFQLARSFPDVQFLAIGRAHNTAYDETLRARYRHQSNLSLIGYIDQFTSDALSRCLGRSWILINTSAKEALPNTFVEALAHRCAILSEQNPDEYATRFGRQVRNGDFAGSLRELLQGDRWRTLGEAGYAHVMDRNSLSVATRRHVTIYQRLMGAGRRRRR